jgi:excisionase family DNA binding protein
MSIHRTIVGIHPLAEYLGTSERHIRGLVAKSAVPYFKVGGLVRFDLAEIDDWLDAHKTEVVA